MTISAITPPRSRSAQVSLYKGGIYVFSDMLVDQLGTTPLRLEAKFDEGAVASAELGQAVRHAIAASLPWVERESFDAIRASQGEPIATAFEIRDGNLNKVSRISGRVTIDDWPNRSNYICSPWVFKRTSGKPIKNLDEALPKHCTDDQLGARVLVYLQDSLRATLAANKM